MRLALAAAAIAVLAATTAPVLAHAQSDAAERMRIQQETLQRDQAQQARQQQLDQRVTNLELQRQTEANVRAMEAQSARAAQPLAPPPLSYFPSSAGQYRSPVAVTAAPDPQAQIEADKKAKAKAKASKKKA